jgi:hypothetical protein
VTSVPTLLVKISPVFTLICARLEFRHRIPHPRRRPQRARRRPRDRDAEDRHDGVADEL